MSQNRFDVFHHSLIDNGFTINDCDSAYTLDRDQSLFQRALTKSLHSHVLHAYPDSVAEFVKGLDRHIGSQRALWWSLQFTESLSPAGVTRGGQQDSLIRLLLNIEELQMAVISLLVEKLLEIAYDPCVSDSDIASLMLANLQSLELVKDASFVSNKMLELLDCSPLELQKEVIAALPEIVSDSCHSKVAEKLCALHYSTPDLCVYVLDALSSLTLSDSAVIETVRHSVLKAVVVSPVAQLPAIVKFLLDGADKTGSTIATLYANLRVTPATDLTSSQSFDRVISSDHSSDHEHVLSLLANIRFAFQLESRQFVSWLKAVSECDASNHRPLDILLLLMLHQSVSEGVVGGRGQTFVGGAMNVRRRHLVEGVLKKQIKMAVFTVAVLQRTFERHTPVLKKFVGSLKQWAALLIRSNVSALTDYGVAVYRQCLLCFSGQQRQQVVLSAMAHSQDSSSVRVSVLNMLVTLSSERPDIINQYVSFIKSWLDILDRLSLFECRLLFQLLCCISPSDDSCGPDIGDDIRILITKQLSSNSIRYKRVGVIGSVTAVKALSDTCEGSFNTEASTDTSHESSSASLLPHQQLCVSLLEAAEAAVQPLPEARGLLADELAGCVWRSGLAPSLERWLCDRLMNSFQETYVVDMPFEHTQCDGVNVSAQFGVDEESGSSEIAISILPLVAKQDSAAVLLPACFRQLRMCVASLQAGSMELLDAVLGCPLLLPSDSVLQSFSSLSPRRQHAVLTSLFIAANFCRELLNAFATQKDIELKRRCIQRLRDIVTLERYISRCLSSVSDTYEPPCARFELDPPAVVPVHPTVRAAKRKGGKAKGNTAKKAKGSKASGDDDPISCTLPQSLSCSLPASCSATVPPSSSSSARASTSPGPGALSGYSLFFREMDMDVFKLLYRRFSLTEQTTEMFCLRPSELVYLLADLQDKLSHYLSCAPERGRTGILAADPLRAHAHLRQLPLEAVLKQAVTLLKPLSMIVDGIVNMLQSADGAGAGAADGDETNGSVGCEDRAGLSQCLTSVYRVISTVVTWSGFSHGQHQSLLTDAVTNLRLTDSTSSPPLSSSSASLQQPLAARAFQLLQRHAPVLSSIESAANLTRTLATLYRLVNVSTLSAGQQMSRALELVALKFVQRDWSSSSSPDSDTGAGFSHHVETLLTTYLAVGDKCDAQETKAALGRLQSVCEDGISELLESVPGRNACSQTFSTLNKSTFLVYYRCLFNGLLSALRGGCSGDSRGSSSSAAASSSEQLQYWSSGSKVFSQLVACVKVISSRSVIATCLRFSRLVVELFVRKAVPVLEVLLKTRRDDVIATLKDFQLSARYLQHVCNHSKCSKDRALVRYVPMLKKGLETFVFRVKAMLALNGCLEAFWLGNLKVRDLQGEEILSQSADDDCDTEGEKSDACQEENGAAAEHSEDDLELDLERESVCEEVEDDLRQDSEVSDAY